MLEFLGLVLLFMLIRLCFPFRSAEEKRQRREAVVPRTSAAMPIAMGLFKGTARAVEEVRRQRRAPRVGTRVLDLEPPKKPDEPMSQTVGKALFVTGVLVILAFLALIFTGGSK